MFARTLSVFLASSLALIACDGPATPAVDASSDDAASAADAGGGGDVAGAWTHAGGDFVGRNSRLTAVGTHDGFAYAAWTGLAPGIARVASDGSGAVEVLPPGPRNVVALAEDPSDGALVVIDSQELSDSREWRLVDGAFEMRALLGAVPVPTAAMVATDTTLVFANVSGGVLSVVERDPGSGAWSRLEGVGEGEHVQLAYDGALLAVVLRPGRTELATLRWDGATWNEAAASLTNASSFAGVALATDGRTIYMVATGAAHLVYRLDGGAWSELGSLDGSPSRPAVHEGELHFVQDGGRVVRFADGVVRRLDARVSGGPLLDLAADGSSSYALFSTAGGLWFAWDEGNRGMREVFLSRFQPE